MSRDSPTLDELYGVGAEEADAEAIAEREPHVHDWLALEHCKCGAERNVTPAAPGAGLSEENFMDLNMPDFLRKWPDTFKEIIKELDALYKKAKRLNHHEPNRARSREYFKAEQVFVIALVKAWPRIHQALSSRGEREGFVSVPREPKLRIEGCRHTIKRMNEWIDQGACPICMTANSGIWKEMIQELLLSADQRWEDQKLGYVNETRRKIELAEKACAALAKRRRK